MLPALGDVSEDLRSRATAENVQQRAFFLGRTSLQTLKLTNLHDDRDGLAMLGDGLRPVRTGLSDDFTEVVLRLLDLPSVRFHEGNLSHKIWPD